MTNATSNNTLDPPMLEDLASEVYNAAQPVNRLPPEILAAIFKALISSQGDFPEPPSRLLRSNKDLKTICLTCRQWYEVAKTLPDLWTTIIPDETRITRAPESIQYAQQRPLTLFYPLSSRTSKLDDCALLQLANAFDDMLERASHLYLSDCLWGPVWIFMRSHAPLLESLSLGLTNQPQQGRYSLGEFLDFLSKSPQLEELKLHDAGPDYGSLLEGDEENPDMNLPTISLPSLRLLELAKFDPFMCELEHLLNRLELPTNCLRLIRPRAGALADQVPAAYFRNTSPTEELVITTNAATRGVAKRDGLLTVYLAPKHHHHGWRSAFHKDFMPEIASATMVYLDLPLEHVPWNAIRNLSSVETLYFLPRDGNFLPLIDLLRSPASSTFTVKTLALKRFELDAALKGVKSTRHREELDELISKGSLTIVRSPPNPPCRVIVDDSIERPLFGYEMMPIADSFISYSSLENTTII
ncbi:hypothetical protein BKA70DRAFT_1535607 [Coprinopsis sp. MPI-PUGE-AT-0042]|nr:hypothetical protein BKA70DRAFT_1535607 [Coprinopsis sp. MPI-PUGE-AT-0042]